MKIINNNKIVLNFTLLLVLSLFFTSCEGDADTFDPNSDVIEDLNNGILQGTLDQNYELDPNVVYNLTGAFVLQAGAELTIPAGTRIVAKDGGSNVFIVSLPTSKLNINGTADNPVFIGNESQRTGSWSGITMYGLAHSLGVRSPSAAFYGGNFETDNSGSISYLTIAGAGNFLSIEEKTNSLGLYGVGSGTKIENIAIINSGDDAVEFYGGSVSITNLYVENAVDDAIDWTEGWNGSITNAYVVNNDNFSTAVEGDFVQIDESNPEVFDNPTISNLTLVTTSTSTTTALQFKNDTGASISGLYIDGFDVDVDMLNNGDVSNVLIDGTTADVTLISGDTTTAQYNLNTGKNSSPLDISNWTWIQRL